jgi:hypothetical protein
MQERRQEGASWPIQASGGQCESEDKKAPIGKILAEEVFKDMPGFEPGASILAVTAGDRCSSHSHTPTIAIGYK